MTPSRAAAAAALVWLLADLALGLRISAAAFAAGLAGLWALSREPGGLKRRPELALALGAFALYFSTFRWHGGDDIPNSLIPFSILHHGTLALDPVMHPWLTGRHDFTVLAGGRQLSVYPVLPGVLATPFYLVTALFRPEISEGFLHDLSKLAGAGITALSAAVFYSALRARASERWALWLAAVYAAGSWAFSLSSQALWQHGASQLGIALGLWGFARPGAGRAFAAGLGFGVAVASRPDNVFLAAAAAGLCATVRWRDLPAFAAGAATPACWLLGYWVWADGALRPPEWRVQTSLLGSPQAEAVWGMLASPSRGLLWFFPPAAFALWAAARRARDPEVWWFLPACAAKIVFLSCYDNWVGGLSFGTRYFASMSLVLLWWLAPLEAAVRATAARRRLWAACAALAFAVHGIGGWFEWPGGYVTARVKAAVWSPKEHPVLHLLSDRGGLKRWPYPGRLAFLAALAAGTWALARRLEREL